MELHDPFDLFSSPTTHVLYRRADATTHSKIGMCPHLTSDVPPFPKLLSFDGSCCNWLRTHMQPAYADRHEPTSQPSHDPGSEVKSNPLLQDCCYRLQTPCKICAHTAFFAHSHIKIKRCLSDLGDSQKYGNIPSERSAS